MISSTEHLQKPQFDIPWIDIMRGQTVVDVGAGNGYWTRRLSTLVGETGIVYALDNDLDLLEKTHFDLCSENISNVRVFQSELLKNNSVDSAFCDDYFAVHAIVKSRDIRSLVEVELDAQRKIAKLLSLVKKGGKLFILESRVGGLEEEAFSLILKDIREKFIGTDLEFSILLKSRATPSSFLAIALQLS